MNYDENYVKKLLPKRPENSHKGTFGHVLNIAGSEFYTGAAYFSSVSALKVGCGLVTLASADTALRAVSALCPDIILMPLNEITKKETEKFQAISIGCGLSQGVNAVKTFKIVMQKLENFQIPLVIDADGINILTKLPLALEGRGDRGEGVISKSTILTPHPKEMSRLMGIDVETILSQPDFWVKKCAEDFKATVVLKLHKTLIADNHGNFYENNTGNSALAHGGSGDVLCGMITGFLAQGVNAFESCCLGVYLHGKAADIASRELTEYSTLASDLIKYIPSAIKTCLT